MSKTIMFIHGAWLTPLSWELFRERFEAAGYETLAPAWPLEDLPIEDIEHGVERFAATLPQSDRLSALLSANPLHVDRNCTVSA